MALTSTNAPSSFGSLSSIGTGIFNGLMWIAEGSALARNAEARGTLIQTLNAKSDAELAAMNLRRDNIAAYVFRDVTYC